MRTVLLTTLVVFGGPLGAARAMPRPVPAPPAPPAATFAVEHARLENRELTVECTARSRDAARCTITLELDVVASGEEDATFILAPALGIEVHLEPRVESGHFFWGGTAPPARAPRSRTPRSLWRARASANSASPMRIAAGARVRMRVVSSRELAIVSREEPAYYILMADALFARHLLFATRSPRMGGPRRSPGGYESLLAPGDAAIEGPLAVVARLPDAVRLRIDGAEIRGTASVEGGRVMSLVLDPGPEDEAILRLGGPFVGAGMQQGSNGERFVMRAGYELGLHDWVIASVAVETDFETRGTSALLLEIATPPALILIFGVPSISAGVGATWDVSERGHRAGLRLALGVGLPLIGLDTTFDYYASDDEWIVGVVGRIGL